MQLQVIACSYILMEISARLLLNTGSSDSCKETQSLSPNPGDKIRDASESPTIKEFNLLMPLDLFFFLPFIFLFIYIVVQLQLSPLPSHYSPLLSLSMRSCLFVSQASKI